MKEQSINVFHDVEKFSKKQDILIVEDDCNTRIVLKGLLFQTGLNIGQVHMSKNGKEGLERFKYTNVDLLITDTEMPKMNGLVMLACICEHPDFSCVPSIVVLSENNEDLEKTIVNNGYGYIRKPFSTQSLKDEIINL